MDFAIPAEISEDLNRFKAFIGNHITPDLAGWNKKREIPTTFFRNMGKGGWYGLKTKNGCLVREPALREAIMA